MAAVDKVIEIATAEIGYLEQIITLTAKQQTQDKITIQSTGVT